MNHFFISDTHFGHTNAWQKFKLEDGVTPLRPFSSTEEMDETMVKNWNSVVKPEDRVYHLGDVVINKKCLPILSRLNGHKRLVMGNHDIFPVETYLQYFEKVKAYAVWKDLSFIGSHVPVHPNQLYRFGVNVHGHLHGNTMKDARYVSVCVEQVNYTPVALEDLRVMIKKNHEQWEHKLPKESHRLPVKGGL